MRLLIQKVRKASVTVKNTIYGEISKGLTVLVGFEENDDDEDLNWSIQKLLNLRIFEDNDGKMNLSLLDIKGEVLAISQFTLYANCKKGKRPSFVNAASFDKANTLYQTFVERIRAEKVQCDVGVFGAHMEIKIYASGPVTIFIDSKQRDF